jgi:spermidine synthase
MRLQQIGLKHNTDKAFFHKYCDFYQEHLPKSSFKGRLLEIGVMDGASLRMWAEYYPNAEIVGIDINDKSHLDIPGVKIMQLDGTDPKQLKSLGMFDLIIDDGSHMTEDQQKSFEYLYLNHLNKKGYYIIEDLHTSFMPNYVNSDFTTIEYLERAVLKYDFFHRDKRIKDSMTCIIRAGQL